RVLGVDKGGRATGLLRRGDRMEREGRLAGRLGAVDLDHPPAREAADAEGHVHRERAGRDGVDLFADVVAELHDRALPELLLDLLDRLIDRSGLLAHSHIFAPCVPKKSGAGLRHTGAAPLPSVFSGVRTSSSLFLSASASRSRRPWAGPVVAPRPSSSARVRAALWTSSSCSCPSPRLDPSASVPP